MTRPETKPPSSRLRILIADDEPRIVAVLAALLATHHVTVAGGGREAIALLSANEFDLVLCDLVMPEVTGMDVYDHVRQSRPGREASMVFMTGGAFTDRARAFLATVPNEILEKPFPARALEEMVAKRSR
jgi:CheY-like chemotaxis protein